MIKMNNTALQMCLDAEIKEGRAGVFLFTGTQPTLAELNTFLEDYSDVKSMAKWKAWINARGDSPALVAELVCEELADCNFRTRSQLVIPFAADPSEMVIKTAGSPTWMLTVVAEPSAGQSDLYFDAWDNDTVALYSIVGSVGAVGTGADLEIVDGEIVDGNTYKMNNVILNIEEQ